MAVSLFAGRQGDFVISGSTIKPLKRILLFQLAATVSLLFLTACASNAPERKKFGAGEELESAQDRLNLVQVARNLIGEPYRYGGKEPGYGFDCSGLVFYSYRQEGVSVPRTAAKQRQYSTPVSASGLRPGDLVFFDTSAKGGHVGIYSGEGRFIHAPSSGGRVREERLDKPYWRNRWQGGGNFLGG